MSTIECVDTGIVFRNPIPNLRAVHTWHPSIARFDDGELIAAFDLGQGAESLDYRTHFSRSRDDGKTWDPPVPLYRDATTRPTSHSIRISRTKDGKLVGFGGRFYRDDPDGGLVNHANLGYVPMDLVFLQSDDRGQSWRDQTVTPSIIGPAFETCHSIIELSDGRWLLPTSTWRGWNGDEPHGMQAIALVSRDRGQTWPDVLWVMDGREQGVIYWEQSMVELPDHRLLSVCWAFHEKSGDSFPNTYAIANDGKTFSPPRQIGIHGQTAKITSLGDGRIVCIYRRHDRPGLWANLARIEGDQWVHISETCLWQGARSGMTGKATAGEELSALKFGYPSSTRLPNGDLFVVFWCCEDCINNIRWLRLRIGSN